MGPSNNNDNYEVNSSSPGPNWDLDIFALTSLKDAKDKGALLQNIGYLCGIRVNNNDGPQNLTRRVAQFIGTEPPITQEMNDFLTETITTNSERETNYTHQGWSKAATSTTSPWISSRIAANNQQNEKGTWLTRRALVQRFSLRISPEDLIPAPEFEAEIQAALAKSTVFQQFEAVYRALNKWGDVVVLGIEMGTSLVLTDSSTNMNQLPTMAEWTDTSYLATIQTARITRKVCGRRLSILGGWYMANKDKCGHAILPDSGTKAFIPVSPIYWRQTIIKEVLPTTRLLPLELQSQLSQLYSQRLTYNPVITRSDSSCRTHDDTHYASMNVSSVIIHATGDVRSVTFKYADGIGLSKHEGSENDGIQHEFVLVDGEHITEMLIWRDGWVYGIQFVTNFGRCSPNMGGSWNKPTVARSKGGVLVGIVSLIKKHEMGHLFRDIQGIWRHDVVDKVPKEDDVFSDYFGSKKGMPFNDRVIVRNSDMAISRIEVRCWNIIDGVQVCYFPRGSNGRYRPKKRSPEDTKGRPMRLQYLCGKRTENFLSGFMFTGSGSNPSFLGQHRYIVQELTRQDRILGITKRNPSIQHTLITTTAAVGSCCSTWRRVTLPDPGRITTADLVSTRVPHAPFRQIFTLGWVSERYGHMIGLGAMLLPSNWPPSILMLEF
ncbi:unnamed protein product, partial [Rhizoctonia solani]